MPRLLLLALFVVAVVATGSLIGMNFPAGAWYDALRKPWFNPPNWLFGPAWTVLYILIGTAGWRLWDRGAPSGLKLVWIVQMVLNFAWSPVFFGLQQPGLALVVVLAMLAAILTFIVRAWRVDRPAAWLFVPYAAWVAFASTLNAAIVILN